MTERSAASSFTTTVVDWPNVVGEQLEELLYGFLQAMGAHSVVWRAGSASGVTASDGGRDIEAIFDRPAPDGELDRQRWWIEAKGRGRTVERIAVQSAVLDASARADVDIVVIATNSRFPNSARDWVTEYQSSHPRPQVRLWDRDTLDRFVQQHPVVAARIMPATLADDLRLQLLLDRFHSLGETPTESDLDYFWERPEALSGDHLAVSVIMFLYAEELRLPKRRTWWTLIGEQDAPDAVITATINAMGLIGASDDLARPLDQRRMLAAASLLLATALAKSASDDLAVKLVTNPWKFVVGGEDVAEDMDELRAWTEGALVPLLTWLRSELAGPCASDCERVTGDDHVHHLAAPGAKEYWQLVHTGRKADGQTDLFIEILDARCVVGVDVSQGCPLIISNSDWPIPNLIRAIRRVLTFRAIHPTGMADQWSKIRRSSPMKLTFVEDDGFTYGSRTVGERNDVEEHGS